MAIRHRLLKGKLEFNVMNRRARQSAGVSRTGGEHRDAMAEADHVTGDVIDDFLYSAHAVEGVADQQNAHGDWSGSASLSRRPHAALGRGRTPQNVCVRSRPD